MASLSRWTSITASMWCWSGITRAVLIRRNIMSAATCSRLQKEWTAKGVVWLTVISSAPGEQGYVTASQENSYLSQMHAAPTAVLLDSDSKVARLYSAKTTPQMVVIDPAGKVIYDGAIDDRPTPDPEDIKGAKNYLNEALSAAMAGKPVPTPYTRPYGCSVKYAIDLRRAGLVLVCRETAGPSTSFGAKSAPNFAQDDSPLSSLLRSG
jgi:hypothetical protein